MATRTLLADPELFLEASWVGGRVLHAADGATLANEFVETKYVLMGA
jgi:hypothetical protein